jgi:hypothetical protein
MPKWYSETDLSKKQNLASSLTEKALPEPMPEKLAAVAGATKKE